MAKARKIVWAEDALEALCSALEWISAQSIQNAERFESELLEKLEQARKNPERFPPDRYKMDNAGAFRSFVSHNIRLSYKVTKNEIRVLRIRHIRQEPKHY